MSLISISVPSHLLFWDNASSTFICTTRGSRRTNFLSRIRPSCPLIVYIYSMANFCLFLSLVAHHGIFGKMFLGRAKWFALTLPICLHISCTDVFTFIELPQMLWLIYRCNRRWLLLSYSPLPSSGLNSRCYIHSSIQKTHPFHLE